MQVQPSTRRKMKFITVIMLNLAVWPILVEATDPRTNSWLTTYSGRYARIYTSDTNKTNGTSATT